MGKVLQKERSDPNLVGSFRHHGHRVGSGCNDCNDQRDGSAKSVVNSATVRRTKATFSQEICCPVATSDLGLRTLNTT